MKKLTLVLSLALVLFTLTACGEEAYNFTSKAFSRPVYEEYMDITTRQSSFISNIDDNIIEGSMPTADRNVFTSGLETYKNVSDDILLIMPIFDLGQSGTETNGVYDTSHFYNTTYKNISVFQVERLATSLLDEQNTYNYRMDWSSGGIVIDYTLTITFNESLNANEYNIALNFQDSNTAVNSFEKNYLVRYEQGSSYFYFQIKNTPTSLNGVEVEYYALSDGYYIARIRECEYVNSVPNYTYTDIMFNNFNGRLKVASNGTQNPTSIKDLSTISYTSFACISDADRGSTLNKYAFNIQDGTIEVDKVTRGN